MNRFLLLLLLLACNFTQSLGQQSTIDDLQLLLQEAETPADKAAILSDIGNEYILGQKFFDSAYFYTERALQLAKEEQLENIQVRSLFNLGLLESMLGKYESSISYYNQTKPFLTAIESQGSLASVINNVGGNYFELKEYDKAIVNYNKGKKIAETLNDTASIAIAYMNIGEANFILNNLEEAKANFEESRRFSSSIGRNYYTQRLFYARTLLAIGDIDNAKQEVEKALTLAEKANDTKYIAEISELISTIAFKEKNYEKAYEYKVKSASITNQLNEAKQLNEIEKLNLNFELKESKEALFLAKEREKYQNIIYLLAGLGVLLLIVLITRQIKVSKMTNEMYDIQKRLVESELIQREQAKAARNATSYDASQAADREFENQ